VQFALVGPEEEEVVLGSASAYALNLEQRSAVGYWLVRQARGRGVASTAVRLLATWGHDAGVGSDRADVWTG